MLPIHLRRFLLTKTGQSGNLIGNFKSQQVVRVLTLVLCSLLTLPVSAQLANTAWPKFRGTPTNSGLGVGFVPSPILLWSRALGSGPIFDSSAAVGADGSIYVGSQSDGALIALDRKTGRVAWSQVTGGAVSSTPALGANGSLYVGSEDSNFYSIDIKSGSILWTYKTGGPVSSSPAIGTDGTVYVGSQDGTLYALNGTTGALRWSHATTGPILASPAIGPDGTVYITSSDQSIYAFNPAQGNLKWYFESAGRVLSSPAVSANGRVYFGSEDNNVYALNSTNGRLVWIFSTGAAVDASPTIDKSGNVLIGSSDGKFYCLSGANGAKRWTFSTNSPILSSAAIANNGSIYFGCNDGNLYSLSSTGSKNWKFASNGSITSSPAIAADGTLYFSCGSNDLIALATTYPGPKPISVVINPSSVPAGIGTAGTVTLDNQALYDGVLVNLTSNKSNASVPVAVLVPQGANSASFPVATYATSATTRVLVTAAADRGSASGPLTIGGPTLLSLTLSPTVVLGGTSSTATLYLSAAARAGGEVVSISSTASQAIVPTAVVIAGGQASTTFTIQTLGVTAPKVATIRATLGTATLKTSLTITPAALQSVTLNASSLVGGTSTQGTITLTGPAPSSGFLVNLSSNKPSVSVPTTVRVPSGKFSTTFDVKTLAVPADTLATVTASAGGLAIQNSLTVIAPVLTGFSISPTTVKGGQTAVGTVYISSVAPAGGLLIRFGSDSSSAVIQNSIIIPAGQTSVNVRIRTSRVNFSVIANISSTLGDQSLSAVLNIN